MPLIFHQNLQRFGGGKVGKVSDLVNIMTQTRTNSMDEIAVAGFTEVTNAASSVPQLKKLYSALDIDQYIIAGVGNTALSNADEYISIGWNKDYFTVEKVGLVQSKSGGGFNYRTLSLTPGLQQGNLYSFPSGDLADSRGIFYIYGQDKAFLERWVFGFMHNMYQVGNVNLFPANLGNITRQLAEGYNNASVVVGGDFNVEPTPRPRNGYGRSCAATDNAGAYYLTTRHHVYDWWYVDENSVISNQDADLGEAEEYTITTKSGNLKTLLYPSDHFPILLNCPM